jgi:hypothetical protein
MAQASPDDASVRSTAREYPTSAAEFGEGVVETLLRALPICPSIFDLVPEQQRLRLLRDQTPLRNGLSRVPETVKQVIPPKLVAVPNRG